jgi:hypothetical protein
MAEDDSMIVNLKLGAEIFPITRGDARKNLQQLYHCVLEAGEYEVKTEVPPSVFAAFVDVVKGYKPKLSEENCESLWLLSEEFGFLSLSLDCAEFMELHWPNGFSKISGMWLGKPDSLVTPFDSGPHVTITIKRHSIRYRVLHSANEAIDFANSLDRAKEDGIVIEGIAGKDRILEKAIDTVYSNTAASLPDGDTKKPFLAFVLWQIQLYLGEYSIDSYIYCLNRLHELAATCFDKAKLLLLSQCNSRFVPLATADKITIRNAVQMLRSEKNGKRAEARGLLRQLKATGRYEAQLKTWNDNDE